MNLLIELSSVALVKIDAGAEFSSLQTASEAIRLYIDLNQGQVGDEDNLNILGFQLRNIFFITNTQRIRMQEVRKLKQKIIYIHFIVIFCARVLEHIFSSSKFQLI